MKTINILLILSLVISISLSVWIYYLNSNQIGDISFNKKKDDSSFVVCDDDNIFQYYSVGTSYKGGKKMLRKNLFSFLEEKKINFDNHSGYITIRFIVSCKGEIGWFRIKMIDKYLKETEFHPNKTKKLIKALSSLGDWNPGIRKDQNIDSYYQINFKIINGQITEIF